MRRIIAVSVGALAIAAAATPALAEPIAPSTPARRGCTLRTNIGYTVMVDDGQSVTISTKSGKTTFKCVDGHWVEQRVVQPVSLTGVLAVPQEAAMQIG
jgi:hypothetical protein